MNAENVTPGNWRVVSVGTRADIRTDAGYDYRGDAVATAADSEFGAMSLADAEYVVGLSLRLRAAEARIAELESKARA